MKITSTQIETSHLPANEEALLRCRRALELKDKDDYDGIREVMRPMWGRVGDRPEIGGLHVLVSAEVLLCVGMLTGWLGSKEAIGHAQEVAKNLISESITSFQAVGDKKQVAAARIELAICYWREGGLDEARIMFNEALQDLTTEGNTRARALLRLSILEWSASRYSEAHRILHENVLLFRKITNFTLKGNYHNQLAMVLRELAIQENRNDYLQRAIVEFQEADEQGKLAHNLVFRANVKNNVGNVLRQVSRFREAHRYLEEARRLMVRLKDKVGVAQTDDTRAQVFIAEKKFAKAEAFARAAVSSLEGSGRQCLLAEALVTHGTALARMGQPERAQLVFERAMDVAHQAGALNKAGLAGLTLIEALDQASTDALCIAFDRASESLADSQSEDLLRRVNTAARKLFVRLHGELEPEDAMDALRNSPPDLHSQVLNYERTLIRHALARANGRVTRAASLLGVSYQGLAYIISSRHQDLLKERTPVRSRGRTEGP